MDTWPDGGIVSAVLLFQVTFLSFSLLLPRRLV